MYTCIVSLDVAQRFDGHYIAMNPKTHSSGLLSAWHLLSVALQHRLPPLDERRCSCSEPEPVVTRNLLIRQLGNEAHDLLDLGRAEAHYAHLVVCFDLQE